MRSIPPIEQLLRIPILLMLAALEGVDAIRNRRAVQAFMRRADLYEKAIDLFRKRWIDRMAAKGQRPTVSQEHEFIPFVQEMAWSLRG